jgi:hypothetical protein
LFASAEQEGERQSQSDKSEFKTEAEGGFSGLPRRCAYNGVKNNRPVFR